MSGIAAVLMATGWTWPELEATPHRIVMAIIGRLQQQAGARPTVSPNGEQIVEYP